MFGKSSQRDRGAAAGGWPLHSSGDGDALAHSEEFEGSGWSAAMWRVKRWLGLSGDSSDKKDVEPEDDKFAERVLLVKKTLKRVHTSEFYTLDAVRQLAATHFRKAEPSYFVPSPKQMARFFENRSVTRKLQKLLETRSLAIPSNGLLSNQRSQDMVDALFDFFLNTGFLDNPAPVRLLLKDKLLTTVMVNTVKEIQDEVAAAGSNADERNHFFYHAVRSEIGGKNVRLRYELLERAEKAAELIPGAVYTTYIYDEPYLKKGIFVIYPRRPNDPARVKFISRWQSPVARPNGAGKIAPGKGHNHAAAASTGTFVEEQKGYIFDQGFDFYIYLFGPDAYKSAPSSERTRRISTIYVDGSNRSGPVMNKIMGSIIAFDSGPKGEIMFQRVVMYRHGEAFPPRNAEQIDDFVDEILEESCRFDINDPTELTSTEHFYREIFMDLGFEATETKDPEDDRQRLEVRRIVQPISDQGPMEIIFDR